MQTTMPGRPSRRAGPRLAGCASLAVLLAASSAVVGAQRPADAANRDPAPALLVTSDIANFWRAYDRAQGATDSAARVQAYADEYLRPGSPGLREWARVRLTQGPGIANSLIVKRGWTMDRIRRLESLPRSDPEWTALARDTIGLTADAPAQNLDLAVRRRPRFFAAIRSATLAIDTTRAIRDSIQLYYRRLAELYPEAVFPPVYFLIGQFTSGGTVTDSGVLIGAEMRTRGATPPTDELNDWERGALGDLSGVPPLVAHEIVHIQQTVARRAAATARGTSSPGSRTLLAQSLHEGCANFVGWTIVGASSEQAASSYGLAHERALWEEFQREMHGTDMSNWLYQGNRSKDRPADLGYFMGARICEAYYRNASDKRQAMRDIMFIPDAAEFLRKSGYAPPR